MTDLLRVGRAEGGGIHSPESARALRPRVSPARVVEVPVVVAARDRGARRGNALTVVLMFGVLAGFSALAVDIGLIRLARTQLLAAADAAALSGVMELDGTEQGVERARARAIEIASKNVVIGAPVALAPSDVVVGVWDGALFTAWDGVDPAVVNAVRVDHAAPPLPSVLGGVAFGVSSYDLNTRTTAMRAPGAPARTSDCFLPIAVPTCWVSQTPPGTNPPPLKFTFSPSPTDAVAWGFPDTKPGTDDLRDQLEGQCSGPELEVGDAFYVDEGAHASALHSIVEVLNGVGGIPPKTWDPDLYGPIPERLGTPDTANHPPPVSAVEISSWTSTLEGPIALVDAGPDCDAVSFTGSMPVTGIAWGVIYDVRARGADKNLYVFLDLVNPHDIWGEEDESLVGNVLGKTEPRLVPTP